MNRKIFTLIYAAFLFSWPVIEAEENLRYAAVLFRHGDRTPVDPYPTDPWKNETLWPVKFGQLTNKGKMQHFLLGQWLRSRYTKLIPNRYDSGTVRVRSTNVDRTLMSALTNLAGFFPPIADEIWNTILKWQPIPVHTVPEHEDEVLAMKKPCPCYDVERNRFKNSPQYKQRLSKYQKLMDYLSAYTGLKVKDFEDINSVYSTLYIETLYNFTLPGWTKAVFPTQMVEPAGYSFVVDTATPLMARLKIGPFMNEVVRNMKKVMHDHNSRIPYQDVQYDDLDGVAPLKLNIYSGHDLNVASVLNGLGLFDGKCPNYTSTVLMELVYDDSVNIHFVKLFYRNTTDIVEPMPLLIPHCGYRCPLERFITIYRNLLPNDWEAECNKSYPYLISAGAMVMVVGVMLHQGGLDFAFWSGSKKTRTDTRRVQIHCQQNRAIANSLANAKSPANALANGNILAPVNAIALVPAPAAASPTARAADFYHSPVINSPISNSPSTSPTITRSPITPSPYTRFPITCSPITRPASLTRASSV